MIKILLYLVLCVLSVRCGIIERWVRNCTVAPNATFEIDGPDLNRVALMVIDKDYRRIRFSYEAVERLVKHRDVDFGRKTILISSGFLDSPRFFFTGLLAEQYQKLNYNVLALDAHYYYTIEYPLSTRYTAVIGRRVAEMLIRLTKYGLNPKNLEIIGLSLGGQTMSFIGKEFQKLTGVKIARFTSLDTAAPCFTGLDKEHRLDSSDADFVDVVASNTATLGISEPVGHINFYINGGENQPGDLWWFPCFYLCSHVRSLFVWLSAMIHLNQDAFIAIQCDSVEQARNHDCFNRKPLVTNVLGLNVDKTKQGIFYLVTDYTYPYFLGKDGLTDKYKYNRNKNRAIDLKDAMKFWLRKTNQNQI